MKKLLVVGVIGLFLGLACAPSINANTRRTSDKSQDFIIAESSGWEWTLCYGAIIKIYIKNMFNKTYRGNISCKFTVNVPIMIYGCSINISDYYLEIEPKEKVLLYRGRILGFGWGEAILDIFPLNIYTDFKAFLLLFFLFLPF